MQSGAVPSTIPCIHFPDCRRRNFPGRLVKRERAILNMNGSDMIKCTSEVIVQVVGRTVHIQPAGIPEDNTPGGVAATGF